MSKRAKAASDCLRSHRCGSSKLSCTYNSATQAPIYPVHTSSTKDALKEIGNSARIRVCAWSYVYGKEASIPHTSVRHIYNLCAKSWHTKYNVYDPCHVLYNCCWLRLSLRQTTLTEQNRAEQKNEGTQYT